MSDYIGGPIFNGGANTGAANYREMFVEQMRSFAETIESSPSGPMLISMLTPYLSMIGATSIIERLDGDSLVVILKEAAEVAENDSECIGVIFGYHNSNVLNLITFDFSEGNVGSFGYPINDPGDTLGEEIFFGIELTNKIKEVAAEKQMVALWDTSSLLCKVKVGP